VPFEIPESWEWCKVEDFSYVASGSTPDKSAFVDNGIPYLKMYNLKNQAIDFDYKPQYIKEEVHNGKLQRSRTEVGDLIMNIVGPPLGKLAIIPPSLPQSNFNQAAVLIRPILQKDTLVRYLFYYLSQMSEINSIQTRGNAGQKNISLTQCQNIRVPMPPLSEQKRIVAEIERWFTLIDDIESNKQDLLDFIKAAKSKILSLAFSGKLVPQDPNDQPAIDLLHGINPNFKSSDNSHYGNLPLSWCVCLLGDIVKVINGRNQSKVVNPNGQYPIYGSGGIMGYADDYLCPENCTIIGRKGTINNPILVETKFWNVDTAFGICPSECIDYLYLYYFCKSFNFNKLDKSTTLPSLTKTNIEQIHIPLPPLAEQKRIVAKVTKLLNLLDKITAEL
jgi:type I restriction enzyme S subunit